MENVILSQNQTQWKTTLSFGPEALDKAISRSVEEVDVKINPVIEKRCMY